MGVVHASPEQWDKLMADIAEKDRWRADQMPDEASALRVLNEAYRRLIELGWREPMYAPNDIVEKYARGCITTPLTQRIAAELRGLVSSTEKREEGE